MNKTKKISHLILFSILLIASLVLCSMQFDYMKAVSRFPVNYFMSNDIDLNALIFIVILTLEFIYFIIVLINTYFIRKVYKLHKDNNKIIVIINIIYLTALLTLLLFSIFSKNMPIYLRFPLSSKQTFIIFLATSIMNIFSKQ